MGIYTIMQHIMRSKKYFSYLLLSFIGFSSASSYGQIITTFAGSGYLGYSGDNGPSRMAQLNRCSGVAFDGTGNVYIADRDNNVVRRINPLGIITTFAGTDTAGYSGDGQAAGIARLNRPCAVATDAANNVYIADEGNNVIRIVSAASGFINTYAGNNIAGYSGDNAAADSASLNDPQGIAIDAAGNLYIADAGNHVVREVNVAGTISTIAGNGSLGYSGDGGSAIGAALSSPSGVAVDPAGNVYIADINNNVVRKVFSADGTIVTFAGDGYPGFGGDGGPATAAQFSFPSSVSVDNAGSVYITDEGNNTVRRVDSLGTISVFAGTPRTNGYTGDNGLATAAQLNSPSDVAADGWGRIYIADYGNNVIRLVSYNASSVAAVAENATGIKVYPNPSNGAFTLDVPGTGDAATVNVMDMLGRIVATQVVNGTKTGAVTLSFSDIADGNYLIVVCSGDKRYTEKVVVGK